MCMEWSTALAHISFGPGPQLLTPKYISSGLVRNPVSPTPYVPPSKKDYEILFPPRAISLDPVVVAAQELLIQPVHLRQLPLIKMYHLLVLHQQIRKFNLKSIIKVRILQKSQENGQSRTNTDTGKEKRIQEPGSSYK
ncbi:hypothetical protein Tco_1358548 [Tanacetum coccineum]